MEFKESEETAAALWKKVREGGVWKGSCPIANTRGLWWDRAKVVWVPPQQASDLIGSIIRNIGWRLLLFMSIN